MKRNAKKNLIFNDKLNKKIYKYINYKVLLKKK